MFNKMERKRISIDEKLKKAREKVIKEDLEEAEKNIQKIKALKSEGKYDVGRALELRKARIQKKIAKESASIYGVEF